MADVWQYTLQLQRTSYFCYFYIVLFVRSLLFEFIENKQKLIVDKTFILIILQPLYTVYTEGSGND